MSNLKHFFYPETLNEASEILKSSSLKTGIIAGGSSLSLSGGGGFEALVDITRIGLDYIKDEKDSIIIGATTTIQKIFKSKIINSIANGVISKAASLIASRPLRNVITLGGNIVQMKIWSDMPIVLLLEESQINITGDSEKSISSDSFFKKYPLKQLNKGEIVKEIVIPKEKGNSFSHYIKFSKTIGDYAIATVGCKMVFEGEICKKARIVTGAVDLLPQRCIDGEKVLENNKIDLDLINKCSKVCRDKINTISNLWGTAQYKSEVVENLIRRGLTECWKKYKQS